MTALAKPVSKQKPARVPAMEEVRRLETAVAGVYRILAWAIVELDKHADDYAVLGRAQSTPDWMADGLDDLAIKLRDQADTLRALVGGEG